MAKPRKMPRWNDAFFLKVYQLAAEGYTEEEIPKQLGVTKRIFQRWMSDKPALRKSIEEGHSQSFDLSISHLTMKQQAFLKMYAELGTVKATARAVGVDAKSHYHWLQRDAHYGKCFALSECEAADILMQEARRRAIEGCRKYKFAQNGRPLMIPCEADHPEAVQLQNARKEVYYARHYYEHQYSDSIMCLLLRGKFPELRDKPSVEVTQNNQPLVVDLNAALEAVEDVEVIDAEFVEQKAKELE